MSRIALFVASIGLPAALFVGCADECSAPTDCDRTEVCYKSTCRSALYEALDCVTDEECGPLPASGVRPYICTIGRCQPNPATGGTVLPDAGTGGIDAGP